jgi:hypothetical protein
MQKSSDSFSKQRGTVTTLWKVVCQEDKYPGMWQQWYKKQCVAVGWPSKRGYKLSGKSERSSKGWSTARNAIKEMEVGDLILVTLKRHRIGKIGEITGKRIEDSEWDPIVPPGPQMPHGDKGRRILVRWELATGPDDPNLVIQIPAKFTFTTGELRPTISKIHSQTVAQVRKIMNDPRNWVGLLGKFGYEKALSDYIAAFPNHLEDGLLPHPVKKIREMVFNDKSRLDVLLLDRSGRPVIVECKQHAATVEHINQLRRYILRFEEQIGQKARGILVHSGALKLTTEVIRAAKKKPKIEIVCYRLRVEFARSTI